MMELSNRGIIDWWIGGFVESWNRRMVERWSLSNRRIVDWSGGVVESSNGGMAELSTRRNVESSNGGMLELSYRRLVEWWSFRVVDW